MVDGLRSASSTPCCPVGVWFNVSAMISRMGIQELSCSFSPSSSASSAISREVRPPYHNVVEVSQSIRASVSIRGASVRRDCLGYECLRAVATRDRPHLTGRASPLDRIHALPSITTWKPAQSRDGICRDHGSAARCDNRNCRTTAGSAGLRQYIH